MSLKLSKLSFGVLQLLCLLFFILTLWNTLSYIDETFDLDKPLTEIILAILAGLVILTFLLSRFLNHKFYLFVLVAIALGVRLVWILKVDTPAESDFYLMYNSALHAVKGNFSFGRSPYYLSWVYQLGFTMYEALVIKIFGNNLFILKLLNVLYSVGTTVIIYKIAAKVFNEQAGRIAGIVYALYMPSILMCSVLTNQHLATFLFYLGFYLLVNEKTIKFSWIYIGLLLGLGDIMRPLGSIILLAVGIYLFLTNILGKNKKQILSTVRNFAGIVVIYFLVHFLVSQVFISMNITKYQLGSRDPMWKFAVGLNHETNGQYSDQDAEYVAKFPIGKERTAAEMKLIKQRTADKQQLWQLIQNKFIFMWASNDASITWSTPTFIDFDLKQQMRKYERVSYACIIFYAMLAFIGLLKLKPKNHSYLLFILLILGYAAIHLLIEIQTRYRYFIIPCFVMMGSYGIYSVYHFFAALFKQLQQKILK